MHGGNKKLSYNHYFQLIIQKGLADLTAEARNGYLGMLWWVIEPILYMSVFYVVFVVVFKRGGDDAVSFLLVGLVIWKWFAASIPKCGNSVAANVGLIRQVYVPKFIFPCMVLVTSTIKFLIIFLLFIVFLFATGDMPSMAWLSLPVLMFVQLVMMLGVGLLLASIVPFLPDLKLIIENGMMLLFFLSGIFFDIGEVSSEMKVYLYLNPMAGLIENYRNVLLDGVWPDWLYLVKLFVISLFIAVLGWRLLNRYDRVYAKVI